MFKIIFTLALIICLSQCVNLQYYDQVPVSKMTMVKARLSMDTLKKDLDRTFHDRLKHKSLYYSRIKLTEQYLSDVSNELRRFRNVVVGVDNQLTGVQNLVVGDSNRINGAENWVFSDRFSGSAHRDLILDGWQIEMDKAEQIHNDPNRAIRRW